MAIKTNRLAFQISTLPLYDPNTSPGSPSGSSNSSLQCLLMCEPFWVSWSAWRVAMLVRSSGEMMASMILKSGHLVFGVSGFVVVFRRTINTIRILIWLKSSFWFVNLIVAFLEPEINRVFRHSVAVDLPQRLQPAFKAIHLHFLSHSGRLRGIFLALKRRYLGNWQNNKESAIW